jgi:hypothetical protein
VTAQRQDVAGVADVERQIREMGFDAAMANNLAEIVRISAQAGKDESAAEIARLSKALSEAEAKHFDADDRRCHEQNRALAAELRLSEAMKHLRAMHRYAHRAETSPEIDAALAFLNAGKE